MNLKEFKANRRAKKLERMDPYDKEEMRLHAYIATLELGSAEYDKAQSELKAVNEMRESSHESKRRISKSDKGGIIRQGLAIVGTIAGIGAVGYYEMKGNTFTGEKRTIADGLTRIVARFMEARRG